MKVIGIATDNFSVYYELARRLRERRMTFLSISPHEPVPSNVGAIITTQMEYETVRFGKKVACDGTNAQDAIDAAIRMLSGKEGYKSVVIGVDPGERPGIAVFADNELVFTDHVLFAETKRAIQGIVGEFRSENYLIRLGHGAHLLRNQIINAIFDSMSGVNVEVVNEAYTTVDGESDVESAIRIATHPGIRIPRAHLEVIPTDGEIRDLQRRSRDAAGDVTISKMLAERVLKGEITFDEAINLQKMNRRLDSY